MNRFATRAAAGLAVLAASALAVPASAQLVLDPVTSGASVTVTGSGATANGPAELWLNGESVGYVQADGSGAFAFTGLEIAEGDALYATASQVWNFNTDGDFEGWDVIGATGVVSGGTLQATATDGNITLNFAPGTEPAILDTNLTRVFEMRYRVTGPAALDGGTVIYDPGTGFQFGPQWRIDPVDGEYRTVLIDISNGGINNYASTGISTQLAIGANGYSVGSVLEVDYIRVSESFDWNFRIDGDLMGNVPVNGSATVAGGALTLTNTNGGTNAKIERPFAQIDTAHFTTFEAAIDADPEIQPNILEFNYFAGAAGFAPSGIQPVWEPVAGTTVVTTIDLSATPPAFGEPWVGVGTLNYPGGWFSPMFPLNAGEPAVIDTLRLRPAVVLGPSATVTATAGASVGDWQLID